MKQNEKAPIEIRAKVEEAAARVFMIDEPLDSMERGGRQEQGEKTMKDMLIGFAEEMARGNLELEDEIMERTMCGEFKAEFKAYVERSIIA